MTAKRHLPVLRSSEDGGLDLSNVQWVLLSALGMVLFFLPLGMLGLFATALIQSWFYEAISTVWRGLFSVGLLLLSFATASFFGAALLGRYASGYRPRWSIYAGLLAAHAIVALTVVQGALRPIGLRPLGALLSVLAVLALVAVFSAFFGGRWGYRRRE